MSSNSQSLRFAFSYGFVGGPLHARKFKRLMRRNGYEYVLDKKQADIIIAHSAGCVFISKSLKPSLVIYVGMPLAIERPYQTLRAAKKATANRDMPTNLKKYYYILTQPSRNINIVRKIKLHEPVLFPEAKSVFIANKDDPWPKASQLSDYLEQQPWSFIELDGSHDDLWIRPQPYVEIADYYARLLAKTNS